LNLKFPESAQELALFNAKIADSKQAENVIIMDMSHIEEAPCDFFVICGCESEPQMKAIADEIKSRCREFGIEKPRSEGLEAREWILVDYFDVVVHIMHKKARDFFKLEKLWADAEFYILNEDGEAEPYDRANLKKLYSEQPTV
jgi:ribosome-associated protein